MLKLKILRVVCTSILVLGLFGLGLAGSASAVTLVPQTEGEVDVGLAGGPLDGGAYVGVPFDIVSLTDSSTGLVSNLFVDRAGTANNYGPVSFDSKDLGTADLEHAFWFRPALVQGPDVESGQLEVGTFLITFPEAVGELTLRLFDTEVAGTSYEVNGNGAEAVPAGGNRNIYEVTLYDVATLRLDLGERNDVTGDGVLFQFYSAPTEVPEPSTALLLVVGVAASAIARRRRA